MGIESLQNELKNKSKEYAEKKMQVAKEEADRILADASEEARKLKERALQDIKAEMDYLKNYTIQSAQLESKRRISTAKKRFLNAQKETLIKETIPAVGHTKIKAWTGMLIKRAKKTIPNGYIKMDENLYKQLSPEYEYSGPLTGSIGGIVVESIDHNFVLDLTFENILNTVWEKKFNEIYMILFKESD